MRYKVLACKALFREISCVAAKIDTVLDVTYMRRGLHDTPDLLREALQKEIDLIDDNTDLHSNVQECGDDFDAILLGYGLCSNGIADISSKKYPLVVPRCDDCIALFIGDYAKYKRFFDEHPGTYWYNASWIESSLTPSESSHQKKLEEYTLKYGHDNALYIMETENVVKNYNTAAYVRWDELDFPQYEQYTKDAAKFLGWEYKKVEGNSTWLKDFLTGKHDERFAIAQPGECFCQEYTGKVIASCPFCKER